MTEAANAPEGLVIEGRYRIVRKIAEGGMATVYQAVDERLDRTVAIKIMHTQLAQGPHRDQFVERFRREAKSAAAIANPHIVQVYDTGEYQGLDYLVMEYVHGVNLRHEMNVQHTFGVRETLRIVSETLDGLSAAHRVGVVHRDIKPENILLNDRGHVQITDFGLAKAASQATLSSTGMLLGTAAYLAPEMIEHNQATPQGDLYSVGITAWEMLAGVVPFTSDNPVTLVFKHVHEDVPSLLGPCPGIDPAVARFVAHLTARAVDARPADASEALRELRELSATLPIPSWQYRRQDDAAADTPAGSPAIAPVPAPPAPPTAGETAQAAVDETSAAVPADSAPADAPSGIAGTQDGAQPPAPTQTLPAAAQTRVMPQQAAGPTDAATRMMPAVGRSGESTQVIGAQDGAPVDDAADNAVEAPDVSDGATAPRRKRRRAVVIAVVAAVLVVAAAVGGAGLWWYFRGPGSYWTLPQPTDVTCAENEACPVTNADWSEYESTLKVAGIPYTVKEDYSDTVAEGDIIATSPANVGDHVSKRNDESVTVTVSRGVRQATIPDDILDPTSDAGKDPISALRSAGFDNVTHDEADDEYSLTVPEGAALSVSPDPGTTLDHNGKVVVTLSKGPMPVTMPTVVGLTQDEAESALSALNLAANVSEEYSDSVAQGEVISASANEGDELHWGDSVDLVVSRGPQMAAVPNVVGQSRDSAVQQLEQLGFSVKTEGLFDGNGILGLVQQQSATGSTRLRDTSGNPTVITLTIV